MADIRAKSVTGERKEVLSDREGRLLTSSAGLIKVYSTTGAAAISLTTTVGADYARPYNLKRVALTFSTAPTTSESITLTHNTYDGRRPSPVIFSNNPSLAAATSVVNIWDGDYRIPVGDELVLAFTNTDTRTIKAEIMVEVI